MRQLTVVGFVFAVLILPATAHDPAEPQSAPGLPAPNTENRQDKLFAQLISANYLASVEFGKMASAKAHRNEVRQFALRLVLDQSKAIANLERLAKQAKIPISDSLGPVDVVISNSLRVYPGAPSISPMCETSFTLTIWRSCCWRARSDKARTVLCKSSRRSSFRS
jgi:Domain of unknown function (DUF4142)